MGGSLRAPTLTETSRIPCSAPVFPVPCLYTSTGTLFWPPTLSLSLRCPPPANFLAVGLTFPQARGCRGGTRAKGAGGFGTSSRDQEGIWKRSARPGGALGARGAAGKRSWWCPRAPRASWGHSRTTSPGAGDVSQPPAAWGEAGKPQKQLLNPAQGSPCPVFSPQTQPRRGEGAAQSHKSPNKHALKTPRRPPKVLPAAVLQAAAPVLHKTPVAQPHT